MDDIMRNPSWGQLESPARAARSAACDGIGDAVITMDRDARVTFSAIEDLMNGVQTVVM